jgi:predicted metalloprotease
MKWQGRRKSDNLETGMSSGGKIVGGGLIRCYFTSEYVLVEKMVKWLVIY